MKRAALAFVLVAACSDDPAAPPLPPGWEGVRNPIHAYPDAAIKDAFAVHEGGRWHLGYSYIRDDPFRFRLGFATSTDLHAFVDGETLDQPETGGLASPTVVRAPNGPWVMTYNSHTRDVGDAANKLYLRTSTDLATWSAPQRIHVEGADADGDRLIDAALAFTDAFTLLFFKREQSAHVAMAPAGRFDGPFTLVGRLTPDEIENVQVLRIDGTWHMLATGLFPRLPLLYRLDGDPASADAFRRWTRVRELDVPAQRWNSGEGFAFEKANASYLVDDRASDGFFYLVYAGSTELDTYENRGHAKLGIARSRDLVTWEAAAAR